MSIFREKKVSEILTVFLIIGKFFPGRQIFHIVMSIVLSISSTLEDAWYSPL